MSTAEAVAEKDRALSEVETAKRRVIDAGLDVLREWAAKGRPFSANDARAQLREVGVVGAKLPGAVYNAALTARIIRCVGYVTSTGERTNGKPVNRYIGANQRTPLEVLTVPAHRTPTGRSTAPAEESTGALFEIGEGA